MISKTADSIRLIIGDGVTYFLHFILFNALFITRLARN